VTPADASASPTCVRARQVGAAPARSDATWRTSAQRGVPRPEPAQARSLGLLRCALPPGHGRPRRHPAPGPTAADTARRYPRNRPSSSTPCGDLMWPGYGRHGAETLGRPNGNFPGHPALLERQYGPGWSSTGMLAGPPQPGSATHDPKRPRLLRPTGPLGGVERPRRMVRFARLIHRPVRGFGGPAVRAAFGGSQMLAWLPRRVIRHRRRAAAGRRQEGGAQPVSPAARRWCCLPLGCPPGLAGLIDNRPCRIGGTMSRTTCSRLRSSEGSSRNKRRVSPVHSRHVSPSPR
jgi:hypothetical protein